MTREEAIEVLNTYDMSEDNDDTEFKGAIALAIKALEQEPCEDCIDRADAMTEIMMFAGNKKHDDDIYIKVSDAVELMRELPSVNPQESKTGHWVYSKMVNTGEIVWSECSVCRKGERGCAKRMKYCPNCGAKMEVEEC